MFNPSRDEVRQFFFATWQKYKADQPLAGVERLALPILLDHPEYHAILEAKERYLDHDWQPESGETNPFLHFSMHLAIEEQLSIDQPVGVKDLIEALSEKLGDGHAARHIALDGLGEMIWHAQRYGTQPDPAIYLNILRTKLGRAEQADPKPGEVAETLPETLKPPRPASN